MDHVVYTDAKAGECGKLLAGTQTMIVRGAAGRKLPYGRVEPGDWLYFIPNDGSGLVSARARVSRVLNSEKLSPDQSAGLLQENQASLQLTPAQFQRWAGKRYLVLVEVEAVETLAAFAIDRSAYGNMDDWLTVEEIARVWRK